MIIFLQFFNCDLDLFYIHQKSKIIMNNVMEYGGAFCAEHGVGLLHVAEFQHFYKENQEILMKLCKQALDPKKVFNPHKILAE